MYLLLFCCSLMQTTMLLEEQPIRLVNIGKKTMKHDLKGNNKIILTSIKPWNILLDFIVKKKMHNSKGWGRGKHSSSPHITKTKISTNLQNSYHSESSENWLVWKSYNQRVKEVTFIQMGPETQRCWTGSTTPNCGG